MGRGGCGQQAGRHGAAEGETKKRERDREQGGLGRKCCRPPAEATALPHAALRQLLAGSWLAVGDSTDTPSDCCSTRGAARHAPRMLLVAAATPRAARPQAACCNPACRSMPAAPCPPPLPLAVLPGCRLPHTASELPCALLASSPGMHAHSGMSAMQHQKAAACHARSASSKQVANSQIAPHVLLNEVEAAVIGHERRNLLACAAQRQQACNQMSPTQR